MDTWSRQLAAFAATACDLGRREVIARALPLLQARVPCDLASLHLEKRGLLIARGQSGAWSAAPSNHAVTIAEQPGLQPILVGRACLDGEAALRLLDHLLPSSNPPADRQALLLPVASAQQVLGVMVLQRAGRGFTEAERDAARELTDLLALAVHAARLAHALAHTQQQLAERDRAQAGGASGQTPGPVLERSRAPAMRSTVLLARQVAITDTPVLLTGETGSGKEVLARAMHAWSRRADGPFVAVNCAALPDGLVESELFGHVAGAFSGATGGRAGRFAVADGGTLLLDEIGELPPAAQATLLRVLQEGCFEAVGSDETQDVDVRIIAASNRDLEREVAEGRFRQDLYYRLAVFPVHVPPLRERRADIALIAEEWLQARRASGGGPWTLSGAAIVGLEAHAWPGNVRELLNCLERATILQPHGELGPERFLPRARATHAAPGGRTLAEHEAEAIRSALARCHGRIYGPGGAAERLGLRPTTLQSRMKKLGVPRLP